MGHKVNPDIFRLGISKTWSYQLRTNKNFIKNLFLFRMLRNLFVNYNIPLFNFKKHRNVKFNDKLILKGEQQIAKSPFVSRNILFSHVIFGMLNKSIFIESYFIDAGMKQQYRKDFNPTNKLMQKAKEYQPWQTGFYKKKTFNNLFIKKKKNYLKVLPRNNYKLLFGYRKFRKLARKTKIFVVKPVKMLSKHFYFFSQNYNWKYNKNLNRFFKSKVPYEFYEKFKKIRKSLRRKKKLKKKFLKKIIVQKLTPAQIYLKRKAIRKKLKLYYSVYRLKKKKNINFFFFVRKYKKYCYRFKSKKARPLRYLRPKKYYRLEKDPNYISRLSISNKINLMKIKYLSVKRAGSVSKAFLKKKSLPKVPVKIFNNIFAQRHSFYKVYHNIKVLKYFIRVLKFLKHFGIKKRIFFCHNLISLLLNFMGVAKRTIIGKKFFLIMQTLIYYSYSLSFFNFLNMKKKYFSKYLIYKAVSKTIFRSVLEIIDCNDVSFSIVGQNKYKFGSSLVLNYILIKLGQYFHINEIVNPLSFFIKSLTCIAGYKILIRGRLTRKERAAVMIRSGKRMPLSTVSANIDYSQGFKIMKFGMVGIKVYLFMKPSTLINLYRFTYRYAKISK